MTVSVNRNLNDPQWLPTGGPNSATVNVTENRPVLETVYTLSTQDLDVQVLLDLVCRIWLIYDELNSDMQLHSHRGKNNPEYYAMYYGLILTDFVIILNNFVITGTIQHQDL